MLHQLHFRKQSVLERWGISLTQGKPPCLRRTNREAFNIGLQLLNEPERALAVRRITHKERAQAGHPQLCGEPFIKVPAVRVRSRVLSEASALDSYLEL